MAALSQDAQDVFDCLEEHLIWLRIRWDNYRKLFDHSERRIELLNDAASWFFFVIQETLFDDVQMGLCRLTDPAETGKSPNATIKQLIKKIDNLQQEPAFASVTYFAGEVEKAVEPLRLYRNKALAHSDLTFSLEAHKTRVHPIPPGTSAQISDALELLETFLNKVSMLVGAVPRYFDACPMDGDADALVALLKAGIRYGDLRDNEAIDFSDNPEGRYYGA